MQHYVGRAEAPRSAKYDNRPRPVVGGTLTGSLARVLWDGLFRSGTVFPALPPSPLAGALEPEQATLAGELLGAPHVIPIHYGGFRVPGQYEPVPEDERRFLEATAGRPYEVHQLGLGVSLHL
jgi:hypothetical protein